MLLLNLPYLFLPNPRFLPVFRPYTHLPDDEILEEVWNDCVCDYDEQGKKPEVEVDASLQKGHQGGYERVTGEHDVKVETHQNYQAKCEPQVGV